MMDPNVGRRKCLAVLGGAIVWPLAARAQPGERVRRVGVLIYGRSDNRGSRAQADSLREGLQELGWFEGVISRSNFATTATASASALVLRSLSALPPT